MKFGKKVKFQDLVGKGVLTAVEMDNIANDFGDSWRDYEDCSACFFELNGVVYAAVEDPIDGYRSCMRDLFEVEELTLKNLFQGQEVIVSASANSFVVPETGIECRLHSTRGNEPNEYLEISCAKTGKLILRVGTCHRDDYYPYFVSQFSVENMYCNQGVK